MDDTIVSRPCEVERVKNVETPLRRHGYENPEILF